MPFACNSLGVLSLEAKSLLQAIAVEISLFKTQLHIYCCFKHTTTAYVFGGTCGAQLGKLCSTLLQCSFSWTLLTT